MVVVGNSNGQNLNTSNSRYVGIGQAPANNESTVAFPLPVGGTLSGLQVRQNGDSNNGGGTQTYTYTLMRNGSAEGAITCAISETATACSSAGTLGVSAGNTVSLRAGPSSNSPTARSVTWSFVITP